MERYSKPIIAVIIFLIVAVMGALWRRTSSQSDGDNGANAAEIAQIIKELPTPNPRAQGLSVAATQDMAGRNYAQAVEKLRQSLEIQPNPETQMQLAFALLKVRKRAEAIQLLRSVAQGQSDARQDAAKILVKAERDPNWGAPKP